MRLLTDRKQTILRSIELQGKLTEELDKRIRSANTAKRLEDYLPYKPKKQTLAQLQPGLADWRCWPREIISRSPGCLDLTQRRISSTPTRGCQPQPKPYWAGISSPNGSARTSSCANDGEVLQKSGKIVSVQVGVEEKPAAALATANRRATTGPTPKAAEPAPIRYTGDR